MLATPTCAVWADYMYLDTDERRRFAQVSHEYLIEQLQVQAEGSANSKYKLNFNHPVKELYGLMTPVLQHKKLKLHLTDTIDFPNANVNTSNFVNHMITTLLFHVKIYQVL